MFLGVVYLLLFTYHSKLKQILLIIFLSTLFSSCGTTLPSMSPSLRPSSKIQLIKKIIIRELHFLPFVKYEFSLEQSPAGEKILLELHQYENIVDDHVKFDNKNKLEKLRSLKKVNLNKLFRKKEDNETIDEKIAEINLIKGLTGRYEEWGPQYDETVDLVGNQLSIYDINSLQKEIKRISRKL